MHSFPLTTEPWISVYDNQAAAFRGVGMTEALVRAHHLVFSVLKPEDVVTLRVLAAAYDAACGPRTTAEWDAAWNADTLDANGLLAYFGQWADHLDLLHPTMPAFQCGGLTEYHRGPDVLHPGSLGGNSAAWMHHELERPLPPYPPAKAAQLLLHLIAYDIAGIKRAVPGDPASRKTKIYGSQVSPLAAATHLHLEVHGTLKDLLLLNLPPQPRARGDRPVWERDTPPAPMRKRTATGRLDLLTWPARRIRLHPTDDGIDAVAHHDGDRLPDTWQVTQHLDPMTAWGTRKNGGPAPAALLDPNGWPRPWRAATLLDQPENCAVLAHAVQAAERGVLDPDTALHAVVSTVFHTTQHRAAVADIPVTTAPLGTAGQLADPQTRTSLATMARYAGAINSSLRKQTALITGRPPETVAPRMDLTNLDGPWEEAIEDSVHSLEWARYKWHKAVHAAALDKIDAFPTTPAQHAKLKAVYTHNPDQPSRRRRPEHNPPAETTPQPVAAPRRRGPAVPRYEVFGGTYTISQLSKHPDCAVSYDTLRKRLTEGWDITEAATKPSHRGRPRKSRTDPA